MPRFSANLGFLWAEMDLPQAVHAAARAGFDAVECHWPYETPPETLRAALEETGLPLLGLNTERGNIARGEFGLSALPGREAEARAAVDAAIAYANAVDADAIHVMAGKAEGPEAATAFRETLAYACTKAGERTILIEPINPFNAPGYFLTTTDHAREILEHVGAPNLKLMCDCYHVARTEGEVMARLKALLPFVGHIQFAAVPDRGAPDHGEVDYAAVFDAIDALGWARPLGAEYKPKGDPEASLGWLSDIRSL